MVSGGFLMLGLDAFQSVACERKGRTFEEESGCRQGEPVFKTRGQLRNLPTPNEGRGILRPLGQVGHNAACLHIRRVGRENLLCREEGLPVLALLEKKPRLSGKPPVFVMGIHTDAVLKASS